MSSQDRYFLTEEDVQFLRQLKEEHDRRRVNTTNRFVIDPDTQTPDVYIVKSPVGGIPALNDDTPGVAECNVYRLQDGILVNQGFTRSVYNLLTAVIPEEKFADAKRDKWGKWWTDIPTTGTDPWEQCGCLFWCKGSDSFPLIEEIGLLWSSGAGALTSSGEGLVVRDSGSGTYADLIDWLPPDKPTVRLSANTPGLVLRSIDPSCSISPDGRMILIENVGSYLYQIANNDTLGTPSMTFRTASGGAFLDVPPRFATWIQYDETSGFAREMQFFNLEVEKDTNVSTIYYGTNKLIAGNLLSISQTGPGVVQIDTNFVNQTALFTASQFTVNNLTINPPVGQYSGVTLSTWLEICGDQFWCCETFTFADATVQDWQPPAAGTVYPVIPASGGTELHSIVPAGVATVSQFSYVARTGSDTILLTTFPNPVAAGNTLLMAAFGSATAPVTFFGFGNPPDAFAQDLTSGVWAGVWRQDSAAGGDTTVTLTLASGPAGIIEMVALEVAGLLTPFLDQTALTTGNDATPTPGPLTPTRPYELMLAVIGVADPDNPADLTLPDGFAEVATELDGENYTVGSAAFHMSSSTAAVSPVWTLDAPRRWAAAQASYFTSPKPQLVVITNNGSDPLTLKHNGSFTAGLGKPFLFPRGLNVVLRQYESAILWYDACDGDGWRLLSSRTSLLSLFDTHGNSDTLGAHSITIAGTGGVGIILTPGTDGDDTYTVDGSAISSPTFSGARVECSSDSFAGDSASHPIIFDSSIYDTDNYEADGVDLPFVIPSNGYYHMGAYCTWSDAIPVNSRGIVILRFPAGGGGPYNVSLLSDASDSPGLIGISQAVSGDQKLGIDDTIKFHVSFFAGGSGATVTFNAAAWIHKLGSW